MSLHVFKVGGCVRDRLLREQGLDAPTGDIDWVVTGATPEAMLARGFIPVGADFPVFYIRVRTRNMLWRAPSAKPPRAITVLRFTRRRM